VELVQARPAPEHDLVAEDIVVGDLADHTAEDEVVLDPVASRPQVRHETSA
jgi:hypothetical protein